MPEPQTHSSPSPSNTISISDMELLTCLLRLRCSPPVPYSVIASLLLQRDTSFLGKDWGGEGERLKLWLEAFLREVYERAEEWESEAWKLARRWRREHVRELVGGLGLVLGSGCGSGSRSGGGNRNVSTSIAGEDDGYVVMEDAGLELQIKWKKEGDWRAGSTALGRSERLVGDGRLNCFVARPVLRCHGVDLGFQEGPSHPSAETSLPSDTPTTRKTQRKRMKRFKYDIGSQDYTNPVTPSDRGKDMRGARLIQPDILSLKELDTSEAGKIRFVPSGHPKGHPLPNFSPIFTRSSTYIRFLQKPASPSCSLSSSSPLSPLNRKHLRLLRSLSTIICARLRNNPSHAEDCR
ncbi:hypothetical protein VTL71DRAFT_12855 [Oculimacula yallundae]|uniref:Uncharacterized protein n=1 Tax=Oculimacula yallundae TaxID=86028 RepID=A0ABR4CP60_9HELO